MSTSSGLVSPSGAPLSTTQHDDAAPKPTGLSAIRASHMVALATAQSALATAATVARNAGRPVEGMDAERVSLELSSLALYLRDALAEHVYRLKSRDRHAYHMIPPDLVASLDEYVATGRETGGFLRAVLENDLADAVRRADDVSLPFLPHLVGYLTNAEHIPSTCWGSPLRVAQWLAEKAAHRVEELRARDELLAEGSRPLTDDAPQPVSNDPNDAPQRETLGAVLARQGHALHEHTRTESDKKVDESFGRGQGAP